MRFKVGDKVKFLNEIGGGVIISIIDSKMVKLETEDGFEMPVLASELIKDFRAEEHNSLIQHKTTLTPAETSAAKQEEPQHTTLINPFGKISEEDGIYLVFEPLQRQWVLTGDLDVLIVNNTSDELIYNFFLVQNSQMTGVDYGTIPMRSKKVIDTIGRDDLENWIKGYFQGMFHNESPVSIWYPIHSVIDIKASRFFKEGSYQTNSLTGGKAIVIRLATKATFELASLEEAERKSSRAGTASFAETVKEKQLIDQHRISLGEAIVDLHIGELVENISGLTSHDMFTIQIEYFKRILESAIRNEYHKVTFIHGVGNGKLKGAITEYLGDYKGIENRMASISKFGVGAIDVLIHEHDV